MWQTQDDLALSNDATVSSQAGIWRGLGRAHSYTAVPPAPGRCSSSATTRSYLVLGTQSPRQAYASPFPQATRLYSVQRSRAWDSPVGRPRHALIDKILRPHHSITGHPAGSQSRAPQSRHGCAGIPEARGIQPAATSSSAAARAFDADQAIFNASRSSTQHIPVALLEQIAHQDRGFPRWGRPRRFQRCYTRRIWSLRSRRGSRKFKIAEARRYGRSENSPFRLGTHRLLSRWPLGCYPVSDPSHRRKFERI